MYPSYFIIVAVVLIMGFILYGSKKTYIAFHNLTGDRNMRKTVFKVRIPYLLSKLLPAYFHIGKTVVTILHYKREPFFSHSKELGYWGIVLRPLTITYIFGATYVSFFNLTVFFNKRGIWFSKSKKFKDLWSL